MCVFQSRERLYCKINIRNFNLDFVIYRSSKISIVKMEFEDCMHDQEEVKTEVDDPLINDEERNTTHSPFFNTKNEFLIFKRF